MNRWFTVLYTFLLIPAIIFAGTTGKLKGKITDPSNGEPLIGANVIVIGTSFGAATDINGEYFISNLNAGTYDVRASFIGYQTITQIGVRVNADLTTELNFQLPAEGISVGEVVVVSQRPLINKSNTNANRITTGDDIDALPVRGYDNILALTAGVVLQDKTIFIRGGRQDEVGFYLEGTNITDPVVGGRKVTLVQDALEEVQVQAGGYTAEFGGANAGIIRQQIKSGTPDFKASFEYVTDNFLRPDNMFSGFEYDGKKTLGTYNWGYNEMIGSISGPILGNTIKFFGLFDYNFIRDRNPQPFPGINIGLIGDPSTKDTINLTYPAGAVFKNSDENYTGTGSLTFDFNPFIFRVVGTYTRNNSFNPFSTSRVAGNIANFLNTDRIEKVEEIDGAISLKGTYLVNPTTYIELSGGYSFNTRDNFDPILEDNFLAYGDSAANADAGVVWNRRPQGQTGSLPFTRQPRFNIFGISFNAPGDVVAGYGKFNRNSWNVNAALSTVLAKVHTLKVGGELQSYIIRNFSYGNEAVFALPGLLSNPAEGQTPEDIFINRGVNNYGYDVFGNIDNSDDLVNQAHKPLFAAFYLQDKIEYKDLIINAGLRFDYIDIDNRQLFDPSRPELTFDKSTGRVWQDASGNYVSPQGNPSLVEVPTFSSVSPRLGLSFPVTDQTVFHAQFGKFVQQSRLRDAYQGLYATSSNLGGGFFLPAPVGFNIRPTRTTQYEVGFTQQVGDFASFDITGFYKDIQDQVVYSRQGTAPGSAYGAYFQLTNGDFATTKGIELSFNMRRTQRFLVNASASFQDAQGTGSFPNSNRGIVGAPLDPLLTPNGFTPQYITPLEFNNSIRGNLSLDYRFGINDGGPILQQLGLSALLTFSSGHPYTKGIGGADLEADARDRQPVASLNSFTTPSTFQLDLRVDKTITIADKLNINIYLFVINLLDTENIQNVFLRTGTTDDDGFISDPKLGGTLVAANGPRYEELYRAINIDYYEQYLSATSGAAFTTTPFFFGPPRQIRLGIKLEY